VKGVFVKVIHPRRQFHSRQFIRVTQAEPSDSFVHSLVVGAVSSKSVAAVPVRVHTGVDLVEHVAAVRAGSVGSGAGTRSQTRVAVGGAVSGACKPTGAVGAGETARTMSTSQAGAVGSASAAISGSTGVAGSGTIVTGAITIAVDTRIGLVQEVAVVGASGVGGASASVASAAVCRSTSGTGGGAVIAGAVTVAIYARIGLVEEVAVVRASSGRAEAASSTSCAVTVCGGKTTLTNGRGVITVRVDAGVELISDIAVVRTSVRGAGVLAGAGTAVKVGVYTRVGLVGDIGVVRTMVGGGSVGVVGVRVAVASHGVLDFVDDVGHVGSVFVKW